VALSDKAEPYEIKTKKSERQLFSKNDKNVIAYGPLLVSPVGIVLLSPKVVAPLFPVSQKETPVANHGFHNLPS